MTRRYTSEIITEIGPEKDIPAPDVGTSPREMAWIFDTYSMNKGHSVLGVVTGKPLAIGGSLGRLEATARGGLFALLEALDKLGKELAGMRVAVQGFGNVGSYFALFAHQHGAKVIAMSDSSGGVFNAEGIDVPVAIAYKQETGSLTGLKGTEPVTNEELLLLDCDILAPSALEQVITEENADKVKAAIILEGANGPTTPAGDDILEDRGVLILPDVLANAGGVVVSYFEWVQGLQEYFWKEDEVNSNLHDIVQQGVPRDVGAARAAEDEHAHGRVRLRRDAGGRGHHDQRSLPVTKVVLYHAAGCHLCERARETLVAVAADSEFELEEVDISGDAELEARYREWLPVVEIDGEQAFTYFVDEAGFRRRLGPHKVAHERLGVLLPPRNGVAVAECRLVSQTSIQGELVSDRVTVGVAARLSRYLQVLTQAKKMGKERISSQEMSDYTNINATQIRRDLSAFGKFGKRGVGYSVDGLLAEIRKILRTQGQHNIALVGAGRLGQAIASSPIFAEHGINIAAVFDKDPELVGRDIGSVTVLDAATLGSVVREKSIVVGVLAVPADAAQSATDELVSADVKIIFNYSEALLDVPTDVQVHTSNPAVELLHALYFHLA